MIYTSTSQSMCIFFVIRINDSRDVLNSIYSMVPSVQWPSLFSPQLLPHDYEMHMWYFRLETSLTKARLTKLPKIARWLVQPKFITFDPNLIPVYFICSYGAIYNILCSCSYFLSYRLSKIIGYAAQYVLPAGVAITIQHFTTCFKQ